MIRVLLVEDDTVLARIIQYYLEQEAYYETTWVKTAGEALSVARQRFDVVLLDVMLPDVSGIELCEKLRAWHSCPIIFISALDDTRTIVNALEMGGDDFITKPFDNQVLAARIQANLRRAANAAVPEAENKNRLSCRSFSLDANRQKLCFQDGKEVSLSQMEFRILLFLMQNPNRYITAKELYKKVWGKDSYGDVRTVLVHIHNLRKKLGEDKEQKHLKSTWGEGYLFDPQGTEE